MGVSALMACVGQQEVQSNHFDSFLSPELQKAGYTAIYKRKTTELFTGNAYAIDGCATFFKRDKFALVKKYEVSTAALAQKMPAFDPCFAHRLASSRPGPHGFQHATNPYV